MSGIKTDLRNLSKSFEKIKADVRKEELIAEFRAAFMRQGYPPSVAYAMAEKKYKDTHS
jgi:hypothetical protein